MNSTPDRTARDALIGRLQKLSKFTVQNGCTEAEATAAMAKVAELMAEHNIQQTELSVRVEAAGCVKEMFTEIGRGYSSLSGMTVAIGKLYNVKPWIEQGSSDALGLGFHVDTISVTFFGLKLDVAAAIATSEIITMAVQTELAKFTEQTKRSRQGKRERADLDASFRQGMSQRISQRLADLLPSQQTGTGLVVLKNQLVIQEFNKLGIHLSSARQITGGNSAAYAAGQAAGARVDLGHGRRVAGARAITKQ